MIKRLTIVLFVFLTIIQSGQSQSVIEVTEAEIIKKLKFELLEYNNDENGYRSCVPCMYSRPRTTLSFFLPLNMYNGYHLYVHKAANASVFVNNRLFQISDEKNYLIPISKLHPFAAGKDTVFVSLYSDKKINPDSLNIVWLRTLSQTLPHQDRPILARIDSPLQSPIVIMIIVLLFGYSFLRAMEPRYFLWYTGFGRFFKNTTVDDNLILGSFSGTSLIFMFLNVLTLSILTAILLQDELHFFRKWFDLSQQTGDFFATVLLLTLSGMILIVLKYILLSLVCRILQIPQFVKVHQFEFNRMFTLLTLIILPFLAIQLHGVDSANKALFVVLIIVIAIWILRLGLITNKFASFKNLYLFFYLCTTEIMPAALILKYFHKTLF